MHSLLPFLIAALGLATIVQSSSSPQSPSRRGRVARLGPLGEIQNTTLSSNRLRRVEERDVHLLGRDDKSSDVALRVHNEQRKRFDALPLDWDHQLHLEAVGWAEQCQFMHSPVQDEGENLATSTKRGWTIEDAIDTWMDEYSEYDYNQPGKSPDTGHFTQVVWKNTQRVGCAVVDCLKDTIFSKPSKFAVCRYSPSGNVRGQYEDNVGQPT